MNGDLGHKCQIVYDSRPYPDRRGYLPQTVVSHTNLKGFKLYIWQPVYHNGNFSHNSERVVHVHARSKEEAFKLVELRPAKDSPLADGFLIHTEPEYIKTWIELGYIRGRIHWDYVPNREDE